MYLPNKTIPFLLIICLIANVGCFTEKVTNLAKPKNFSETLLRIEKAIITDSENVYIELTTYNKKDRKKDYVLNFNYHKIIENYQSNNKTTATVVLLPKDYKKSGIESYYYEADDSTETFVFNFDADALLKNNMIETDGKDIKKNISVYKPAEYKSFYNPDAINLTYNNETAKNKLIVFKIFGKKKSNNWAYALYPFSVACDIATFPVQIVIIIKRIHDLKKPILKF